MGAWKRLTSTGFALLLAAGCVMAQNPSDPLQSGFENPPSGARPRVWWHWMNGNITQEGIKMDLEWMHQRRVSVGSRTSMPR